MEMEGVSALLLRQCHRDRLEGVAARALDGNVDLGALATTTSRFRRLFAAFDRGLHVVPAPLQLPQNALGGHLSLEMFDGALDAFVSNGDFERFALNGLRRHVPALSLKTAGFENK